LTGTMLASRSERRPRASLVSPSRLHRRVQMSSFLVSENIKLLFFWMKSDCFQSFFLKMSSHRSNLQLDCEVQELRKLALVFNLHNNTPSPTSPYFPLTSGDKHTKPDYDHLGGLFLATNIHFGLYPP
jgi:hypothetical protein